MEERFLCEVSLMMIIIKHYLVEHSLGKILFFILVVTDGLLDQKLMPDLIFGRGNVELQLIIKMVSIITDLTWEFDIHLEHE